MIWEWTKFDTERKSSTFLLEIMMLLSPANNSYSDIEFILRGGHLYISWKTEALELILLEFHVSMYHSRETFFIWIRWSYFNFLSSVSYIEPEPIFQLHMELHKIVIELAKFHDSRIKAFAKSQKFHPTWILLVYRIQDTNF